MGLAFLNKKSWHTGSFQNIEKVWIAEQKKKEADRKEIEHTKKLKEERQVEELKKLQVQAGLIPASALDRMDWIYEWGNKVQDKNKEEYLLGRAVDEVKEKKPHFQPLFKESTANSQNEAFTKLHEDPLFLIRQEELKRKKEIIENPIKMKNIYKEVEELTKHDKKKDKKEKKHKHKKEKKHKDKDRHKHKKSEDKSRKRSVSSSSTSRARSVEKRRGKDSTSKLRSRSRSRSKDRKIREHENKSKSNDKKDRKHSHHDHNSSNDQQKSKIEEPKISENKVKLFEEYMKKRLGPNVKMGSSENGFIPDFNINRKKIKQEKQIIYNLTEEEKQKLVDEMKNNASQLQKDKENQIKKDFQDQGNQGNKNYISEMRKEVYSKPDTFADLGDRVSRNMHYLARNLEEKNTFKK